jgi:hypothetical protein
MRSTFTPLLNIFEAGVYILEQLSGQLEKSESFAQARDFLRSEILMLK